MRAVGEVNFLSDRTQTPSMRMADVDRHFGVSESTGSSRLAEIRELIGLTPFDPDWCLPSRLEDNPLVWMLRVNGVIVDIREAPRDAQEDAYRLGLIPWIPADRPR